MRHTLKTLFAATAIACNSSLAAQEESDLFKKLDANADGFVSADEVSEEQKSLFDRLIRKADKDSDKNLSKEEFQAGLQPDEAAKQPLGDGPGGREGRPNPGELFKRLDANQDGKLTKDELPPGMLEGFARLDADGDGTASQEELGRWIAAAGRAAGEPGRPPGAPNGDRPRPGTKQYEDQFDRADANHDGKLTKDEIPAERREMLARLLERFGDESVTKEQFVRGMAMMAQAGGRPPGAPDRRPDGPPPAGERDRRPEGRGMPGGPGGPGGPPRPFIAAIDTNQDGELSKDEIEGASKALLTLDKNNDGKLSREELFPGGPPPGPPGGPFGARPGDASPREGRPGDGRPGEGRPGDAGKGRPGEGRPGEPRPGDPRPGDAAKGRPPEGKGRPPEGKAGGFSPEAFRDQLNRADKDGDGKLSKEEAPDRLKENFDRLDANSDGFLDETERRQLLQRMLQGKGKRPEGKREEPKREEPKRDEQPK